MNWYQQWHPVIWCKTVLSITKVSLVGTFINAEFGTHPYMSPTGFWRFNVIITDVLEAEMKIFGVLNNEIK